MSKNKFHAYIMDKVVDLVKHCSGIALLLYLIVQVPNEAVQIIGIIGAFLLGDPSARQKIGL